MAEVVMFGEPMVVWIPGEAGGFSKVKNFTKGIAGAELNVSIGLARLNHSVKYVTRLGEDILGEYILRKIENEKIDAGSIVIDKRHLTGSYFKTKVAAGDPEVFYLRKNSAASYMSAKDVEGVDFTGVKILHITGILAAISENCYEACTHAIDLARKKGILVSFDPNIRENLWDSKKRMIEKINSLAIKADLIMPGVREGEMLTSRCEEEEICDYYLEKNVSSVIVKLGAEGAFYKTGNGEKGYAEGFRVSRISDTVGAGDAFAAGVLSALLEGEKIERAVKRGNAMGALVIMSSGDNDAMPTRKQLFDLINDTKEDRSC